MWLIYRNAKRVVIWLGPEAQDSDLAMRFLEETETFSWRKEWLRHTLTTMVKGEPLYGPHYDALFWLHLRPYWDRLWVLQEIAYAQDVLVQCGVCRLEFSTLTKFGRAFEDACREDPGLVKF